MKIALILPLNVWAAPYASIYTHILNKLKINYDIIYWNRDLSEPNKGLSWNHVPKNNRFSRFTDYYAFSKFIKHRLTTEKYDKIIFFNSVLPIYLLSFLKRRYRKQYIIDIRDLSMEQFPLFKNYFKKAISNSAINIVSSPGFIEHLPKTDYVISHNFDIEKVRTAINSNKEYSLPKKPINILTIGQIRDYEANVEITNSLMRDNRFQLSFVGGGEVQERIFIHATHNDITNISFTGRYDKSNELNLIEDASFVNIFMPSIKTHNTAMSNRFYNALLMKKPLIATEGSIQGELVKKHKLGVTISNGENLSEILINFLDTLNMPEFSERCNNLLKQYAKEYDIFESRLIQFITEK